MSLRAIVVFALLCAAPGITAQPAAAQVEGPREHGLFAGRLTDTTNIALAGVTTNKALTDLYFRLIGPALPRPVSTVAGIVWQTSVTYLTTIWFHEFGHWARANEVDGDFIIDGFALPWPRASMDLPPDVSMLEETLTSVAGFEINVLMRSLEIRDFVTRGYGFADELTHSFVQAIYFPGYALVIAPLMTSVDPANPATWTNTQGDPLDSALLVYRNYTGRSPFLPDGSVDQDLISYYREYTIASLVWTLLDPFLYQGAAAFGVDLAGEHGRMTPWTLGRGEVSWIWSTLFVPSPLGYELHLHSYLVTPGQSLLVAARYGRPFRNVGLGVTAPTLLHAGSLRMGATADYWYQEPYGHGGRVILRADVPAAGALGFTAEAGWKTAGYVPGERLEDGLVLRAGGRVRF